MSRYICIHGHFYQPPRENPWLEAIEQQDSARPYHDWNERITAECYAPNAAARILDGDGRIARIANNYARISFNFGPTLLSWMEDFEPETYAAILQADRESRERFSGHGCAMAQAYNHVITPLANQRDLYTQVRWGIADFRHRFQREPEGMWLPETAVDLPSLEALAAEGIRFTVLAPHQARRVRGLPSPSQARAPAPQAPAPQEAAWRDVPGGDGLDLTMPYQVKLPSGNSIAVFFYDGPISRAVAFEGLLRDGAGLAQRLLGAFHDPVPEGGEGERPQLVTIATDGETYGHHHRHGEMALAFALDYIERESEVRLTNYGEFLALHPPTHEAEIAEATAWSCAHGVERWRSDCGCNTGRAGWNQAWRGPLRGALDWLRDQAAPLYEGLAADLLKDPWAARDAYIEVVLDRSPAMIERFMGVHGLRPLSAEELPRALKLLELQRQAMLMYTSCGWFFDEISGIEATQVLQYAGRALELAEAASTGTHVKPLPEPVARRGGPGSAGNGATGLALEEQFLHLLEGAPSNLPEIGNGRAVYERSVRPARVGLADVGAHYVVSSLFEEYADESPLFCYVARREAAERFEAGAARLIAGRARVTSTITQESELLTFGVLHLGGTSISCGVRAFHGEDLYRRVLQECGDAFARADFAEVIRLFDRHFGSSTYSLRTLFKDEQRKILDLVLATTVEEAEALYRQLYQHHAATLRFLASLNVPAPRGLATAAEFVLNRDLEQAIGEAPPDLERCRSIVEDARVAGTLIHTSDLSFALEKAMDRATASLQDAPWDSARVRGLEALVAFGSSVGAEVNLWRAQNVCYALLRTRWATAGDGDPDGGSRAEAYAALARRLWIRVD